MSDLVRRDEALSMLADIKVPDNDDASMYVVGMPYCPNCGTKMDGGEKE